MRPIWTKVEHFLGVIIVRYSLVASQLSDCVILMRICSSLILLRISDNNTTNFGAQAFISMVTPTSHPTLGTIGGISGNAHYHFGPSGSYSSLSTSPFGGLGHGGLNNTAGAILRGGSQHNNIHTGILSTYQNMSPNSHLGYTGFRCVWTP